MYTFQKIFNLLPSLNLESVTKAIIAKTNDMHLVRPRRLFARRASVPHPPPVPPRAAQGMYVASLVRTIAALHDLVNNKIQSRELEDAEERRQAGKSDAAAKGDKEEAGKKGEDQEGKKDGEKRGDEKAAKGKGGPAGSS